MFKFFNFFFVTLTGTNSIEKIIRNKKKKKNRLSWFLLLFCMILIYFVSFLNLLIFYVLLSINDVLCLNILFLSLF
jgi:uncharacterized membrane protein